ncbi:MAG TPA: hypothetical protein VJ184_13000 [Chryseolinea sp.]|nr:hypothetical protein [Chryseolinea sp.]
MKYKAKVYYCGWMKKGRIFELENEEVQKGLMLWDKVSKPVFWISRPREEVCSIEPMHSFGVEMELIDALDAYKKLNILAFRKKYYS